MPAPRAGGATEFYGDDAMKSALVAFVSVLAIAGCSGLMGSETLTGEIDSIDRGDRLVTIDGERYQIDENVQISDLDEGDKVTITVESDDPYDMIVDID
jgi:PDZ domain-containing secreted protein